MQALIALIITLVVDTAFSWARMFIALGLSVVVGLFFGIYAARSSRAERVLMPIFDILQTVPILAFFPFAIYVVVTFLPGLVGINVAVIFLIVTSMVWNIGFGVYEAVKTVPVGLVEMARIYGLNKLDQLRKIFIPASMQRVVGQSILSWSIGLFYLVTSEIFSIGSGSHYAVRYGIGVALLNLAVSGNIAYYLVGIGVFVLFVVATRFLFFRPLERYFGRYEGEAAKKTREGGVQRMLRIPSEIKDELFSRISRETVHLFPKRLTGEGAEKSAVPAKGQGRRLQYIVIAALVALVALFLIANGTLRQDEYLSITAFAATFARIWLAFGLMLVVAVPLCVYLVFMTRRSGAFITGFQVLASIPATILLPLIVSLLVNKPFHNEIVAFTIFFLSGIWYVVFSILASSRGIPSYVGEVRRVFQVKGKNAFKNIYVKALVPGIITGAITGLAAEWNASIVAEYFTTSGIGSGSLISSVNLGFGKLLDLALQNGNVLLMGIALLNLVVIVVVINRLLWKRLYGGVSKIYR